MVAGQDGDNTAAERKKVDFDFLSSIEFLVLDQAEAFVFQNPEHLEELFKVLNKTPKKLQDLNDINRIKPSFTHSIGQLRLPKFLRQNIIVSKFRQRDLQFIYDQHAN